MARFSPQLAFLACAISLLPALFIAWIVFGSAQLDPLDDDLAPLVVLQGFVPVLLLVVLGSAIVAVLNEIRLRRSHQRAFGGSVVIITTLATLISIATTIAWVLFVFG